MSCSDYVSGFITGVTVTVLLYLFLVLYKSWAASCDGFSDAEKERIATDLHSNRDLFKPGQFRNAQKNIKSINLDAVLFEDVRQKKPSNVEDYKKLLE